jgi:hypothetical protein
LPLLRERWRAWHAEYDEHAEILQAVDTGEAETGG